MARTTIETVRELIDRVSAAIERDGGWMEIHGFDDGALLVGGELTCHDDGVEFEDDSGFRASVPYHAIAAVWSGRQGGTDYVVETVEHEAERWRIAS